MRGLPLLDVIGPAVFVVAALASVQALLGVLSYPIAKFIRARGWEEDIYVGVWLLHDRVRRPALRVAGAGWAAVLVLIAVERIFPGIGH